MNATVGDVADGELVMFSCSLTYRTSSSKVNVQIIISHPGAEVIANDTRMDENERVSSVVMVKAKTSKNTTQFGPFQCKVVFTQPKTDSAQNEVQFSADEISAAPVLCKYT